MRRRRTRKIMLGELPIGGGSPISVQSMTKTPTSDFRRTLRQIRQLEAVGCDVVRVAVPDQESVLSLGKIVAKTRLPVVADVHFDHRLALASIDVGASGIRVNPGTIGRKRLAVVGKAAASADVCVRVGVNSGSLERRFKSADPEADALVESALDGVSVLEDCGVENIKISVKASDVRRTIESYRKISRMTCWPLHVGVTESGTLFSGTVRSAVGIGALLAEGIGDTIRVSLSAHPVEEVRVGKKILKCLGLAPTGVEVISCPTCARAQIDVIRIAEAVERSVGWLDFPLRVAVMGCAVNGPGEACAADIGIAGTKGGVMLFKKGRVQRKVPSKDALKVFIAEVEKMVGESGTGKEES